MVTKAKAQAAQPAQKARNPLHDEFGRAVKFFDNGKPAEAAKILEALEPKARETGEVHLLRGISTYLVLCAERSAAAKETKLPPEMEAQLALNRKDSKGALAILDKALKTHPKDAKFHYLKAAALAQQDHEETSAASLKTALELEPDFAHVFRLEPDFEEMRGSSAFAFTQAR